METRDTIVAPATAPGEGGIGILRLSGDRAEALLGSCFVPTGGCPEFESHRLYHGKVFDSQGQLVDEVMAVVMKGPRSYTREDVAEIHCHGGSQVVRRILDLFIDAGARLARPGEFTLRAFLNGRIDLAQAEAVIDLIRSRSEVASNIALQQMEGGLSKQIHRFRAVLADTLSLVEAYIDFPEEEIELPIFDRLVQSVEEVAREIEKLLATFDSGRILREGISVLILGRPNVGKSSLLNALLGEARAIVTEIPGTTRDTIEEQLVLGGIPLRLIDTAGVRDTVDPVESEGVRRARQKVASADLVILVVDGSQSLTGDDQLALEACADSPVILVVNKDDLPRAELGGALAQLPMVRVSARSGIGIEDLQQAIVGRFQSRSGGEGGETVMLSDRRHREALVRCQEALHRFGEQARCGVSPEFLSLELRESLQHLGEITGETTADDILERIFLRFCIGK